MITLTKYGATWCPPCKMMKPVLKELRKIHPTWKIIEIDIDQNEKLADKENIQSVPTLIFSDGKKTKRKAGFMNKIEIETFVKKTFGGDSQ
ncbi:thioredoxin family protein [Candidatus Woesearchaeota archaeon]|nr:thioredoxin family protein [Candidatus Woesearchaeota archaeon]